MVLSEYWKSLEKIFRFLTNSNENELMSSTVLGFIFVFPKGNRVKSQLSPNFSTGPASTSGIAIMPRRTMQGILSIVVQHYIQKMLARETKSIFSFRLFLSKISKIKKMKKYFPYHFCHILIYGEFIRRIYEKVFDISFFMNLNSHPQFEEQLRS